MKNEHIYLRDWTLPLTTPCRCHYYFFEQINQMIYPNTAMEKDGGDGENLISALLTEYVTITLC